MHLLKGGAMNNKAIKALLDMDAIKYENDNLVGLEEQLKALRETDVYLFKSEETPKPSGFIPKISDNEAKGNQGSFKSYEQILSEIN